MIPRYNLPEPRVRFRNVQGEVVYVSDIEEMLQALRTKYCDISMDSILRRRMLDHIATELGVVLSKNPGDV